MARAIGSHHRPYEGATNVWLTPQHILDALGPFDMDPCAATMNPGRVAPRYYTEGADGLIQPWHGLCFVNPPYGPHVGPWLKKCGEHGNAIALVMARTETASINPYLGTVDAALFLRGRLTFLRPDGTPGKTNAGAPSVLLAWGEIAANRIRNSGLPGVYFPRPEYVA